MIEEHLKGMQTTADKRNIDFSAHAVYETYKDQHRTYWVGEYGGHHEDYALCKTNEFLELLIGFYGVGGGGRSHQEPR